MSIEAATNAGEKAAADGRERRAPELSAEEEKAWYQGFDSLRPQPAPDAAPSVTSLEQQ